VQDRREHNHKQASGSHEIENQDCPTKKRTLIRDSSRALYHQNGARSAAYRLALKLRAPRPPPQE